MRGAILATLLPAMACSDLFFFDPASADPVAVSLRYTMRDAQDLTASGVSPGEVFDMADRAFIRIASGSTTHFEEVVELNTASGDRTIEIEVDLDQASVSATVEVELRSGTDALFTGSVEITLEQGTETDATLPLSPVEAGLTIDDGPREIVNLYQTVALSASTVFATGDVIETVDAVWSSASGIVDVSSTSGVVTGHEAGQAQIEASYRDMTASTTVTVLDRCDDALPTVQVGDEIQGELTVVTDCLVFSNTPIDRFQFTLTEQTGFVVTAASSELGIIQLSQPGGIPGENTIGRPDEGASYSSPSPSILEYLLPAGSYELWIQSWAEPHEGPYTLSLGPVSAPQVGCNAETHWVKETSVSFGVVVEEGVLTTSDCVNDTDEFGEPARWWDGYLVPIPVDGSGTVTATADFPFELQHWDPNGGASVSLFGSPNEELQMTVSQEGSIRDAFIYVINMAGGDTGTYSISFSGGTP